MEGVYKHMHAHFMSPSTPSHSPDQRRHFHLLRVYLKRQARLLLYLWCHNIGQRATRVDNTDNLVFRPRRNQGDALTSRRVRKYGLASCVIVTPRTRRVCQGLRENIQDFTGDAHGKHSILQERQLGPASFE
ncbi:hypothetical protein MRX96_031279 [Rhipicephalus microplus]